LEACAWPPLDSTPFSFLPLQILLCILLLKEITAVYAESCDPPPTESSNQEKGRLLLRPINLLTKDDHIAYGNAINKSSSKFWVIHNLESIFIEKNAMRLNEQIKQISS
jgi:hypothetical protein